MAYFRVATSEGGGGESPITTGYRLNSSLGNGSSISINIGKSVTHIVVKSYNPSGKACLMTAMDKNLNNGSTQMKAATTSAGSAAGTVSAINSAAAQSYLGFTTANFTTGKFIVTTPTNYTSTNAYSNSDGVEWIAY